MYDFVVIGAGINGSWTALHLAKRNTNVLLLEQVRNLPIKNDEKIHVFFTQCKKNSNKISCSFLHSCKKNYVLH